MLFTLAKNNKLLINTHYNLKGNPSVYFLACVVKDKVIYYALEKTLDNVDEKTIKRLKKNNGKLKKFIEKDYPSKISPEISENEIPSELLKEKEGVVASYMNSIGFLKQKMLACLSQEVS